MRTVLITGATSGIGKATAFLLAGNGYRMILTGRRKEKLNSIYEELSKITDVLTLNFDVSDPGQTRECLSNLPGEWKSIDVLINNAGNAHGLAPIQDGDPEDWEAMIDINVKGLLYISKLVTPGMVSRKSGHIINIGSIAGKEVYPQGNVYCASKYAVDALTKGMRLDLAPYGIKVSEINPGLVNTEFSMVRFKGDAVKSEQVYRGMDPLLAEDIAETVLFILSRPAHVNIAEMLVLPRAQASATQVSREN